MPRGYVRPDNDHLSIAIDDIVPAEYRGTDQFLDILSWNIRYFHALDSTRVERITAVLEALNADIFVFQEIENEALEEVAAELHRRQAGPYKVRYGTTGGDQRVAFMYDREWVRAKEEIEELFADDNPSIGRKKVFPRLPLHGVFTSISYETRNDPFDFQLLGLHLKSQRGGGEEQREQAAAMLSNWLETESAAIDADVVLVGDWNEPPEAPAWEPFRELERQEKAVFSAMNDSDSISHLMYRSKTKIGSRLDLHAVSAAAATKMKDGAAVVRWKSLDAVLASSPRAETLRRFIRELSEDLSDHMPVVTRFYFTETVPQRAETPRTPRTAKARGRAAGR